MSIGAYRTGPWNTGGGKGFRGGKGSGGGKGGFRGAGGKGHGGHKGGKGGGYDWTKHLPQGHPSRLTRGLSYEEKERLKANPEFQRQREEYFEEKNRKKQAEDEKVLASMGLSATDAA